LSACCPAVHAQKAHSGTPLTPTPCNLAGLAVPGFSGGTRGTC
jgi:hypothetical protein